MSSESVEPREALESLDVRSASETRRKVAEIFRVAADADAAALCKCGIGPAGEYYTALEAVGAKIGSGDDGEVRTGLPEVCPDWSPRNPPQGLVDTFWTDWEDLPQALAEQITQNPDTFSPPDEFRFGASAYLYQGSRCVACMAVLRVSDRPFTEDELEKLNELISPAVEVLAAVDREERALVEDSLTNVLLDPETMEVLCTTESAENWLDERRTMILQEEVRPVARGDGGETRLDIHGFCVRVGEMVGPDEERFLATVEYPDYPMLSLDSVLTPRQREVVEYAAAGATNREIADTLEISSDTVSDHLSASYERLGVANRVELARKVAETKD